MNTLQIVLLAILTFALGFCINRLLTSKNRELNLPKWTNKDLDSTIVAVGMLVIFGGFVEEANISDKDTFTRLVELFNGVWLLILGFLFGKMNNGHGNGKGDTHNGTS